MSIQCCIACICAIKAVNGANFTHQHIILHHILCVCSGSRNIIPDSFLSLLLLLRFFFRCKYSILNCAYTIFSVWKAIERLIWMKIVPLSLNSCPYEGNSGGPLYGGSCHFKLNLPFHMIIAHTQTHTHMTFYGYVLSN